MRRFLAALAAVLLLAAPALALSDAEYKRLLKDKAFARADKALTQAWNEAKKSFPDTKEGKAAYALLLKDQREWIASGRDQEAGEIMADAGYSRTEAYIMATLSRSEYIPALAQEYLGSAPSKKAAPKPAAQPATAKSAPRQDEPKREAPEFLTEGERREAAGDWRVAYPDIGVCVGDSVRLREDPGTDGEIVGRVNKGDWLVLLGETSTNGQRWYAVDHPAREGTAFIIGRYVETYKGYETGTPAYGAMIQVLMNFGITPEKALALLGEPRNIREGTFFFEPAGRELSEKFLDYPNCQIQYVEGRPRHVEVWERGLSFGPVQVGDSVSQLSDALGEPALKVDEGWTYEATPSVTLLFELEGDTISRMTYDEYME